MTDTLDFAMNFEDNQQSEADKKLLAVFYKDVVKNETKSTEAGRPIFDEIILIKIITPGSRDSFIGDATEQYQQRFPQQWARFKAGQAQQDMGGTPLNQLPWLSIGQVAELNAVGCHTIEHLVGMPDSLSQKFMGHHAIKQRAQQYLDAASAQAPALKLEAELKKRDEQISELQETVNALLAKQKAASDANKVPLRRPKELVMTVGYWTALDIIKQTAGELGLPRLNTITGIEDVQSIQLLSLLNSSGNELMMYYPWAQFAKEWIFDTVVGQEDYPLPDDWLYFRDQTQWDRTDHWPLLGPKSPQEWAWLKGSLVAALPRQRFRVSNGQFKIWPVPTATPGPTPVTMAMEYVNKNWVIKSDLTETDMVDSDGDTVQYNPWLVIKFIKFKFYELKGFPTTGVQADFMRVFNSLTGQDTGAKILSLSPQVTSQFIGPWSIPDGSWNVFPP